MAGRLNPAEQTAAESDYEKKFSHTAKQDAAKNSAKLKQQEAAGDANWKTATKKSDQKSSSKKSRFRFAGGRAGKLRQGSAFLFIFGVLGLGIWYTSVFAPNILLVNIKEMYTNDLADATIALDTYYKKVMGYKLNRSSCGEKESIKCKLSTMSRGQKEAFEKQGFIVLGSKVQEDNRDDGQEGNEQPESRYQVTAILPPSYSEIIDDIKSTGSSWVRQLLNGNTGQLSTDIQDRLGGLSQKQAGDYVSDLLNKMPIVTGDMLWVYAQLSSTTKAQVYSVFNPKSSFFMDARFRERLKTKYNLTKSVTTAGSTEQAVNRSFDNSVKSGGGIDMYGRPDPSTGVSLGSLSNPATIGQLQIAAQTSAVASTSFVSLQCAWYSLGKSVTNNAKTAKATTIARFAMQYLKAADAVKAGTADVIGTNVLSSKLAQSSSGGYDGPNATDSSMYQSIVHGELPYPSPYGLLYYLDTFDLYGALAPAWTQIMASAAAQGTASNVPGMLTMPPFNLTGTDRDYCLGGEPQQNHAEYKTEEVKCQPQVNASAPPGWQGALAPVLQLARETCPPPHYDQEDRRFQGEYIIQPSLKATSTMLTPYVAGIFGANVMLWANVMSLLFTSETKGVAASDVIFAGTGEILGDMAMSRGMMPSNAAFMAEYMVHKPSVDKDLDEVAQYNGRKKPFDVYNKYSFLGSIVHSLSPTYSTETPLLATANNAFSLLNSGIKKLNPSADAIYYLQPAPFNPLRLTCPDPEYLAIGIMADTACNVRYSFTRLELVAQIDSVLDYMTKTHNDVYQPKLDELNERLAQADTEASPITDKLNIERQIADVTTAMNTPFIDKKNGRATPNGEYEKFLNYCVNRQDPWGRSAMAVRRTNLPDKEILKRLSDKTGDTEPISSKDSGDPYEKVTPGGFVSVSEGAKSDQDWYSGKKCTELSEMLTNFRAYTMICSVDGSLSGAIDCTMPDNSLGTAYSDSFYTSNDILYTSWY